MLDCALVKAIARQQDTYAGEHSIVVGAGLVKLCDGLLGFIHLAQLEVGFGQEVEILRLIRILLDLVGQLFDIELVARRSRQMRAIVEVFEEILIGKRSRWGMLGERFEGLQVAIRSVHFVKAPLQHRQLVVTRGRVAAYADEMAQKFLGLLRFLGGGFQIGQLQQGIGEVRRVFESLLKELLRSSTVALALGNKAEVEQAKAVFRIKLKPKLKLILGVVIPAQISVRHAQEGVGTGGMVDLDELVEDFDCLLRLSGEKVTLAKCSHQRRPLGIDLQTSFQHRNGVLVVPLRHAHLGHEEEDVEVFRGQLARADKKIEGIKGA